MIEAEIIKNVNGNYLYINFMKSPKPTLTIQENSKITLEWRSYAKYEVPKFGVVKFFGLSVGISDNLTGQNYNLFIDELIVPNDIAHSLNMLSTTINGYGQFSKMYYDTQISQIPKYVCSSFTRAPNYQKMSDTLDTMTSKYEDTIKLKCTCGTNGKNGCGGICDSWCDLMTGKVS